MSRLQDLVSQEEIKLGQAKLAEKLEQEDKKAKETKVSEIPEIEYLKCFCWVGFSIEAKNQGNTSAKIGCCKCKQVIADTTQYYADKCQEIGYGMVFCKTCFSITDPAFEPWLQDEEYEE